MSIWSELSLATTRFAADVTAIVNRVIFLERTMVPYALDVNTDYEDKDSVTGKFKKITYKRLDGTVIKNITYEIDSDLPAEIPPKLNLKRVTVFSKDGITILEEAKYRILYDSEGDIVSETFLSV